MSAVFLLPKALIKPTNTLAFSPCNAVSKETALELL